MRTLIVFLFSLFLLGCQAADSNSNTAGLVGTDITGAEFPKGFNLTDHTGKPRKMQDFQGKVVAMFFGYTHCPDICPTTMADLKQAMKLLGDKASEVQVLFITLDPDRDTQEVLAQFVPGFDNRFLGLRGTPEQTAETAQTYKVFFAKLANNGKSGYTIDHSAGMYLFDKTGKPRIYVQYGQKPADIVSDIKTLL